ncbi:tetratricopeptide repeat protein [Aliarcobacter vitoriensis]|uniref:tetratricopeptide repeat protein n=1 Tax=Aliarcobacter vitoriensis TaxID=2011099 RepID=UPI003AAB727C
MFKVIKLAILVAILPFIIACSSHNQAMKVLPNELEIADQCKNMNINFEMDCYDLISYKNSFAQIRLGIQAQNVGLAQEALDRYTKAQRAGNFYSNALISNLYANGIGVEVDEKKSINLLKDVQEVDPIAAYRLSFYYFTENNPQKAIELLEYSAQNGVKDAQKDLVLVFSNNQYLEEDEEKSLYYDNLYQDGQEDFTKKIYGR